MDGGERGRLPQLLHLAQERAVPSPAVASGARLGGARSPQPRSLRSRAPLEEEGGPVVEEEEEVQRRQLPNGVYRRSAPHRAGRAQAASPGRSQAGRRRRHHRQDDLLAHLRGGRRVCDSDPTRRGRIEGAFNGRPRARACALQRRARGARRRGQQRGGATALVRNRAVHIRATQAWRFRAARVR